MLRVRRAAAIAKKDDFTPAIESVRRTLRKHFDSPDEFGGKALLYAATFAQLRANGIMVAAWRGLGMRCPLVIFHGA